MVMDSVGDAVCQKERLSTMRPLERDARKDGDGQAVDCKWLSGKEEKRDKIQWEAASSCLNTVTWWK